ncbi:MAG TPA: EF-hand domain-containing protein [Gemmataceae bacterium]|nr:EF-hand domain-containing protein [Gemmataceae bacterium]
MKRRILLVVLAAVLPCGPAEILGQPRAADSTERPPAVVEGYDFLFLGDPRPVLIRLHMRIDGKPLRQAWDRFIESLFRYLDRDGNGTLSEEELQRAPRPQLLSQLLRGNFSEMRSPASRSVPEVQVSLVGGKVTREGLAAYYRLSGVEPLVALIQDKTTQAEALTDALFKGLDLNQDGKLSKEELLAAPSSARALDLNDDELITIQELLPNADMNDNGRMMQREAPKPLSNSTPLVLLSPGDSPTRLAYILLGRYDKDQNQKLSRTEIHLDAHLFDLLDLNHDGELDAEELARFLERQAIEIELIVQLNAAGKAGSIDIYDPLLHAPEKDAAASETESRPLALKLGAARIDLQVSSGLPGTFQSMRQFLVGQFEALDAEKRGSLNKKQIEANAYLAALFPPVEGNGQQELSKEEFVALLDLLGQAMAGSVVLTITDEGRGLFEMLNSHHDGRLRPRELKLAWSRLAPWDQDGDGSISRNEIPHHFHLQISQGPTANLQLAVGAVIPIAAVQPTTPEAAKGPLWFRKMDRNGDGEISLREWLGSKADFQRIDTNGDGVISVEEAERADAQFRKQQGKAGLSSPHDPTVQNQRN